MEATLRIEREKVMPVPVPDKLYQPERLFGHLLDLWANGEESHARRLWEHNGVAAAYKYRGKRFARNDSGSWNHAPLAWAAAYIFGDSTHRVQASKDLIAFVDRQQSVYGINGREVGSCVYTHMNIGAYMAVLDVAKVRGDSKTADSAQEYLQLQMVFFSDFLAVDGKLLIPGNRSTVGWLNAGFLRMQYLMLTEKKTFSRIANRFESWSLRVTQKYKHRYKHTESPIGDFNSKLKTFTTFVVKKYPRGQFLAYVKSNDHPSTPSVVGVSRVEGETRILRPWDDKFRGEGGRRIGQISVAEVGRQLIVTVRGFVAGAGVPPRDVKDSILIPAGDPLETVTYSMGGRKVSGAVVVPDPEPDDDIPHDTDSVEEEEGTTSPVDMTWLQETPGIYTVDKVWAHTEKSGTEEHARQVLLRIFRGVDETAMPNIRDFLLEHYPVQTAPVTVDVDLEKVALDLLKKWLGELISDAVEDLLREKLEDLLGEVLGGNQDNS